MLWKITLEATQDTMETLDGLFAENAVSTSWFEKSPFHATWCFEALWEEKPDINLINGLLRHNNVKAHNLTLESLENKDWLAENRKTFQPVQVGRFFIHDSYYQGEIPQDVDRLIIDAATAFGTGHHETTRFCLQLLLELDAQGKTPVKVLDLGCGTGILGMAAYKLWKSQVLLTDNDPEAIVRTQMNLATNVCVGTPLVAEGLAHSVIQDQGPFDLILANILAQPLLSMASTMANQVKEGGYGILSGILFEQADTVIKKYETHGFCLTTHLHNQLWSGLLLQRR